MWSRILDQLDFTVGGATQHSTIKICKLNRDNREYCFRFVASTPF